MSRSKTFVRGLIGVVAAGALVALSGCAPTPQSTPTPEPTVSESPAPDPYAGPIAFVGDELDWFLLSAEEISGLLPDVGDVSPAVPSLIQVSDGGGYEPDPAICNAVYAEASLGSIGARSVTWTSTIPEGREGWLHVLQFADEAAATARMDQYAEAAEQCGSFEYGGAPSSFASSTVEGDGGVRAIAGSLVLTYPEGGGYSLYKSYSSVGNVIVEMWQPFTGEPAFDTEAAAALLRDRASEARAKLIDELTENPPVSVDVPAADPAAPWSEWEITTAGVGPVRLGAELDEAIAAVPGARVAEPEWPGAPTRLISADGSASLVLWTQDESTVVAGVSVGIANVAGDLTHDGASLPSADGVRVGDPLSAAVSAFPQGTALRIVSSGEYFYEWSSREGVVMRFRLDRDSTLDAAAVITGVMVEDATLRKGLIFG
ncbi:MULTISPECIES: sensor domain-containing protein [unclassified Microbacterium]|uniref:sensor domain-containing protein n=1 Tax=unclassified Microbacterium TaxID=2609290 RepID=UPI00109D5FBD|nr:MULTISPECIES: sensor domain-containing protein [unclassified Microbacterium]